MIEILRLNLFKKGFSREQNRLKKKAGGRKNVIFVRTDCPAIANVANDLLAGSFRMFQAGSRSDSSKITKNMNSQLIFCFYTTMEAPQAFMVLLRSSSATRPAQNIPRSAKYCVATSPIGSFERTTLAPDL